MAEPARLVFDRVGVSFDGAAPVLDEVSFEVPPGGVTALIGPNNSGKSTLLRAVVRLLHPAPARVSGTIRVDDVDVHGPDVDVVRLRRRAVFVPPEAVALPGSIRANVAFGLEVAGLPARVVDERVEEALRLAGLWDELGGRLAEPARRLDRARTLQLGVARALALDPGLLLLDEPTVDLDPANTARIEEILPRVRERTTVVVATNDLAQAGRVAEFTAFLLAGRVVEVGRTEDLFTRPRKRATEEWLAGRTA